MLKNNNGEKMSKKQLVYGPTAREEEYLRKLCNPEYRKVELCKHLKFQKATARNGYIDKRKDLQDFFKEENYVPGFIPLPFSGFLMPEEECFFTSRVEPETMEWNAWHRINQRMLIDNMGVYDCVFNSDVLVNKKLTRTGLLTFEVAVPLSAAIHIHITNFDDDKLAKGFKEKKGWKEWIETNSTHLGDAARKAAYYIYDMAAFKESASLLARNFELRFDYRDHWSFHTNDVDEWASSSRKYSDEAAAKGELWKVGIIEPNHVDWDIIPKFREV